MSKAKFEIAYDGPALRAGLMDVNDLAPALLSIGDLLREANRELNGEHAEVSVKVRADFQKGSFDVALLLDQSLLEQAKGLLFPAGIFSAGALVTLLFGAEAAKKGAAEIASSVIDLWKKLRGEKPKNIIEDTGKNITMMVTGNNNRVYVIPDAARLYADDAIRHSIAGAVRPVSQPGIDSVAVQRGRKVLSEVRKEDLPAEGMVELVTADGLHATTSFRDDTRLRVVRANFEQGKWGFSDGSAKFSADIRDEGFLNKLDAHEIGFYKGDILRVRLRIEQTVIGDNQFQTKYMIDKVLEHIHAPKQQQLPGTSPRLIEPPSE